MQATGIEYVSNVDHRQTDFVKFETTRVTNLFVAQIVSDGATVLNEDDDALPQAVRQRSHQKLKAPLSQVLGRG
jgi:hypothetical protein